MKLDHFSPSEGFLPSGRVESTGLSEMSLRTSKVDSEVVFSPSRTGLRDLPSISVHYGTMGTSRNPGSSVFALWGALFALAEGFCPPRPVSRSAGHF